jgi:hypothetical protein
MNLEIPQDWVEIRGRTPPPGTIMYNSFTTTKKQPDERQPITHVYVSRKATGGKHTVLVFSYFTRGPECYYCLVEDAADGAMLLYHLANTIPKLRAAGVVLAEDLEVDLT